MARSTARFYFFDLDTKQELTDHPLNGSVFDGTGSYVDYDDDRLPARDTIYVGNNRPVTVADFDGRTVGVKLWHPATGDFEHDNVEKFFLVPTPPVVDDRSPWQRILDEVPEPDRSWVAREARIFLNMTGGRPSDAARSTVAAYESGTLRRSIIEDGHLVGSE